MSIKFSLAAIALIATIIFASRMLFGSEYGKWIGLGVLSLGYLALKLISDNQEKLLNQDIDLMDDEDRISFVKEVREKGIMDDKNNT